MWPSAILFSTWWSCLKRCACNWSQALTDTAFLLLSSIQLLLFDWSAMAPMLSPLLWWCPFDASCLLRHQPQRDLDFYLCWTQHDQLFDHGPYLFPIHCGCHPENPICRREAQSILILWFSSDCCHYIPRDSDLHVSAAQIKPFPWHRQNGLCLLHNSHSFVESHDLQPAEPRGKNALRKVFEKCYFLSLVNIKMYLVTLSWNYATHRCVVFIIFDRLILLLPFLYEQTLHMCSIFHIIFK